jgi:hypothetical protein
VLKKKGKKGNRNREGEERIGRKKEKEGVKMRIFRVWGIFIPLS